MLNKTTRIAVGAALVAGAAAFAPAAHADRIGFNVSIGGPGYALSFGDAPYWGHRPYFRPYYRPYWGPAYLTPPVVYTPRVVYVEPRARVVYRAPYVRYPVVVRHRAYYDY